MEVRLDKRRGGAVVMSGLERRAATSVGDGLAAMRSAASRRTTADNNANLRSSRSHAVTMMEVSSFSNNDDACVRRYAAVVCVWRLL